MAKVCDMDCFNCKFPDCINDYVRPSHRKTEKEKAANRAYLAKRYASRKAAGVCRDCGRPAYNGSVRCYECRLKSNRLAREAYRKKHPVSQDENRQNGRCYYCGAERVLGKKVCAKHLEMCRKNLQKANSSPKAIEAHEILRRKIWNGVRTK